jgi:AraC-like DNA-binding protein
MTVLPRRLFRGNERIRYLWDELLRHYQTPHAARVAILRATALFLFLEILHCSTYSANRATKDIQSSLEYIAANIGQWLPLSMLAGRAGLSLSRYKMKFRSQVGMPPGEYILREKIRRAEEMLAAGNSVTYTAHELAFSSSQHLSTVFKAFTGRQPRDGKQ